MAFSTNTVNAIGQGLQRIIVDSKAMRKVKDAQALIEVVENISSVDGAFSLNDTSSPHDRTIRNMQICQIR